MHVPEANLAQLSGPHLRDIGNPGHHVVPARDSVLTRTGQLRTPRGEERDHLPARRRHTQPEIAPMPWPVERIHRRLHAHPETAEDLPSVPLLQEREKRVNAVQLLPRRGRRAFTRTREILVEQPWR